MDIENSKLSRLRAFQRLRNRSLQELVNEASRILGNPIILSNLDWEILAYTEGVVTDDPFWNHHMQNTTITEEMMKFGVEIGYDNILMSEKPVVLFHSDTLKYDRLRAMHYCKDMLLIGYSIMVASNKPFEDGDTELFEAICRKITKEMEKNDQYKRHGQIMLEHNMTSLIEDTARKSPFTTRFVELIYYGMQNYLYAAVADIGQRDPTYARLDEYKNLLKSARPAFRYSIYLHYIVIIMSTDVIDFSPKKCLHRLNKLIERDNIRIGISSRFENLFELPRYYAEAVSALKDGLKSGSEQHIFLFE